MDLPAATVATTIHASPPERFTDTFGALLGWIISNGYEFYGSAREVCRVTSKDLRPGKGTVIQQPMRKKK